MANYFFKASKDIEQQIVELYNFLWPTASALWNFRWQVRGYLTVRPDANTDELSGRFVHGSGLPNVDYKASCVNQDWDEQLEIFARFLIVNLFALHESWTTQVLTTLGYRATGIKQYEKQLQFPTKADASGRVSGIWNAINDICSPESAVLKNTFYSSFISSRKYSANKLDNLMRCYRYFKECRNCIMHDGGVADQKLLDAYNDFAIVATVTDLGVEEVPLHSSVTAVGEKVRLHLRGIVGLGDVIIRIVTTCDSELLKSQLAEQDFLNRWKAKHQTTRTLKTKYVHQRNAQLKRLINQVYYISPNNIVEMEGFLKRKALVN